ncbi:MAG: M48 family metallopeptidase [Nitrospira sp.]|nr:M48 family metallopeptidase [Nitrospira sp.]
MYEELTFAEYCARVRFALDEPIEAEYGARLSIADFVARVRSAGLQVTARTVPAIHAATERVRDRLRLEQGLEVYVINDPSCNAYAPAFVEDDRPIIVLCSGLIQLLLPNELDFVIGHELGHLGLRHATRLVEIHPQSEYAALQARSRQRYAEISADRIGLLASRSTVAAARIMLKVASGLSSALIGLDIEEFVRQIDRDQDEANREWELCQSHPSLPLRLWALIRFSCSDVFQSLSGSGAGGIPLSQIDHEIAERLSQLGDGLLSEMQREVFQKALVWAALAMVIDDRTVNDRERAALTALVGPELAGKALSFAQTNSREDVHARLADAISRINSGDVAARRKFEAAIEAFAISLKINPQTTAAGRYLKRALK